MRCLEMPLPRARLIVLSQKCMGDELFWNSLLQFGALCVIRFQEQDRCKLGTINCVKYKGYDKEYVYSETYHWMLPENSSPISKDSFLN